MSDPEIDIGEPRLCVGAPRCGGCYGIYTTEGQMPKDSVNPILTERGIVQPVYTMALGYRKCIKTNFDWTAYLFPS